MSRLGEKVVEALDRMSRDESRPLEERKAADHLAQEVADALESLARRPKLRNFYQAVDPSCSSCIYWTGADDRDGQCRRQPPVPTADEDLGMWPETFPEHFCGEGLFRERGEA